MSADPPEHTRPLARPVRAPASPPVLVEAPAEAPPELPGAEGTPTLDALARLRATTLDPAAPRYLPQQMLGHGGMGDVHAALDTRLRREVALKTLKAGRTTSDEAAVRFFREAQITARLDHPNVVPVYDLGVDGDGRLFYTMKRVEGRSLAEAGREEELSDVRRLQLFVQICDAIAYAHDRGVVHRDLKPANVMVGAYGEVIVLDWGLAKRLAERDADVPDAAGLSTPEDASTSPPDEAERTPDPLGDDPTEGELTRADTVLGTPTWMAPEQAVGEPATPASDQYALGAVLYFLMTREAAFRSGSDVLAKVVTSSFRSPRMVRPAIPPEVEAIVLRAMERDPGDRYPSVAALRDEVQAFLEGREVQAMRYTRWMRLRKAAQRHRGPLVAAGAVAGVGIVLAIAAAAAGTWMYVTSVRAQEARAANAEREARLQLADGEVALALMHADLGLDGTARGDLARARANYVEAGATADPASAILRTGGLPLRPWFAGAWIDHQHPAPLLAWDASASPVETAAVRDDEAAIVFLAAGGNAFVVDATTGATRAQVRIAGVERWYPAGWEPDGTARLSWTSAEDGGVRVRSAPLGPAGLGAIVDAGPRRKAAPLAVRVAGGRIFVEDDEGIVGYDLQTGTAATPRLLAGHLEQLSRDGSLYAGRSRQSGSILRAAVDHGVWHTDDDRVVHYARVGANIALDPAGSALLVMEQGRTTLRELDTGRVRWSVPETSDSGWLRDDRVVTVLDSVMVERDPQTGRPLERREVTGETGTQARTYLPVRRAYLTHGAAPALALVGRPAVQDLDPTHPSAFRLDLSPDGVLAATTGGLAEGTVRLRDARTGRTVRTFTSNPTAQDARATAAPALTGTRDVAFSPTGDRLATADRDGHVRVWTLDGAPVADHAPGFGITISVDWTPGGLAACFEGGQAVLYDVAGTTVVRTLTGPVRSTGGVALSPDGAHLVVAGRADGDPTWALWDARTGTVRSTSRLVSEGFAAAWSPDGTRFVVTRRDGKAEIVDLADGATHVVAREGLSIAATFLTPDIVAIGHDSSLDLWRVGETAPFGSMVRGPEEGVADVAWDGEALVVLRDGNRLTRVGMYPDAGRPLMLGTQDGVAPGVLATRLALWGRWRAAVDALAGTTPSREGIVAAVAARLATGDVAGARALAPALQDAGIGAETLRAWLATSDGDAPPPRSAAP